MRVTGAHHTRVTKQALAISLSRRESSVHEQALRAIPPAANGGGCESGEAQICGSMSETCLRFLLPIRENYRC